MKPNVKDKDFNRITQILRNQTNNKRLFTQISEKDDKKLENLQSDRLTKKSPSPVRTLKKDTSLSTKKYDKVKKLEQSKSFENNKLKEQIKNIESFLENFSEPKDPSELQLLFSQLQKFVGFSNIFKKISQMFSIFKTPEESQKELLQTFIYRQNKQNSEYLQEQLEILMQENENLKQQIQQSRKERLERMRCDELLLEQLRQMNQNSKKINQKESLKIDLQKLKAQKGFHQEFMEQIEAFSESWRNLAKSEHK